MKCNKYDVKKEVLCFKSKISVAKETVVTAFRTLVAKAAMGKKVE